jgi:hypothetical protein
MNDDGHGRRLFDGVMSHVVGAGKVFANHRFGMPGRTATQHEDRLYPENWFPFGNAVTTDPLVIETNSSTESWQKGTSLVHTDPTGRTDWELPPNVRSMIAATQHSVRREFDLSPNVCVNPRNPQSATPALRVLFVAREEGEQRHGAAGRAAFRQWPTAPRSWPKVSGCHSGAHHRCHGSAPRKGWSGTGWFR